MPVTFNNFDLQDSNFITERVTFKGFANRAVIRANINRREGVKLLATEFGEKIIEVEGVIVAASASDLQTKIDNMKASLQAEEADLVVETGRTWTATVLNLAIPDEHYNLSRAPFMASFLCSNPFSEGVVLQGITPVLSGIFTFSGQITITGSFFNRPSIIYTPPSATGKTLIRSLTVTHVPTGQSVTVSGFGSNTSLGYQDSVTINYDELTALEGSDSINTSGAFSRWEPGVNQFTITASGRAFPGGSVTVSYNPRYI